MPSSPSGRCTRDAEKSRQRAATYVQGAIHDGSSECPPWRDISIPRTSKRRSAIRSALNRTTNCRLAASASKYSLLIRVWFSPLAARLSSIQSRSTSCKSAACFGSRRLSMICAGPACREQCGRTRRASMQLVHSLLFVMVAECSRGGAVYWPCALPDAPDGLPESHWLRLRTHGPSRGRWL